MTTPVKELAIMKIHQLKWVKHAWRTALLFVVLIYSWFAIPLQTTARADGIVGGNSEYFIPGEAGQLRAILVNNDNDPAVGNNLHNVITVSVAMDNTTIYYDHWENGYGTGNTVYDERYTANKGTVLVFESPSVPANPRGTSLTACPGSSFPAGGSPGGNANNCYDGRDRIYVAGGAVSVAQAFWPTAVGTVYANAWEVYPIKPYQTNYVIPVGEDLHAAPRNYDDFYHVYVIVQATQDDTNVQIDTPSAAGIEVNVTLNRGQVTQLMPAGAVRVYSGTTVTATKPVQVQFIVGDSNAGESSESRSYTAVPSTLWDTTYYSPVPSYTTTGADTDLYIYNPTGSTLTINYQDSSGSGSFNLPANSTRSYQEMTGHFVPNNSAVCLTAADGITKFWAIGSYDTESASYNWGFSLIPLNTLTSEYFIGWAPGTTDYSDNGSPVYVTPTQDNTTIFVDYSPVDGSVDATYTLNRIQIQKIFDPDNNNTGMHISATHPIAVMWGEDSAAAAAGNPYIDAGYTVLPLNEEWIEIVVALDKTANPDSIPQLSGQTSEFTINVTVNASGLNDVYVVDTLPADWAYINNSTTITLPGGGTITGPAANPSILGSELTWNDFSAADPPDPDPLDMPGNSTLTITYQAQTTDVPAEFNINEGVATGTYGSDTFSASDTATVIAIPGQYPSFTIAKDADVASVDAAGDVITYTVTLTNTGNVTLTGVSATDPLLADLDCDGVAGVPYVNTGLTIAVGGSLTCTGTYTVTQADIDTNGGGDGDIDNTVMGDTDQTTSQTASEAVTITQTPELTLVKSIVSGDPYSAVGGTIGYQYVVTNTGNVSLTGPVTIADDQTTDESCPAVNTVGDLDGELDPLESITCTASHTVTQADIDAGSLTNTATASADGTTSNEDSETAIATQPADLSLSKTVDNPTPYYGTQVTFTVSITNGGPNSATNVHVSDPLQSGFTYVSDNPSQGTYTSGTGDWDVGSLAVNQTETLDITATVILGGAYDNTAEVSAADQLDPDSTPANNNPDEDDQASAGVIPQQQNPDGLSKIVVDTDQDFTDDSLVAIGEILTYRVSVNIHPGSFVDVTLVDTLQPGLSFVECVDITAPGLSTSIPGGFSGAPGSVCSNPTVDDAGGGTPLDVDRRVAYNFGILSNSTTSDHTLTIIYRAIVLDSPDNVSGFNLSNSAVLSVSGSPIGTVNTTAIVVEPKLAITKTSNNMFIAEGNTITFTLTIRHTAASETNAYDLILQDVLPAGLDFVDGTLNCTLGAQDPDPGSCVYLPGPRAIQAQWTNFTLTGGISRIRFRVRGNASLPSSGSIANTATVAWTSLPGDWDSPITTNPFSTERFYDPGDEINVYGTDDILDLTILGGGGGEEGGGGGGGRGGVAGRFLLPVTGFAPARITALDGSSWKNHVPDSNLYIQIPSLHLKIPIVGVPLEKGNWNISSIWNQAGWLQGTAYPTYNGNSVITSHVVTADGKAGSFTKLKDLTSGEHVYIMGNGYRYIYVVRSMRYVKPDDISILEHRDNPWLTLLTCDKYDEESGTYLLRVVVQAELVQIDQIK
jgi:LPXTG-site transpeptidase (sortase) family protein